MVNSTHSFTAARDHRSL